MNPANIGSTIFMVTTLGAALFAVLTVLRRAAYKLARENWHIYEKEAQLERDKRIAAESRAVSAEGRADGLERYAAPAAFKRLIAIQEQNTELLKRMDERLAKLEERAA